MTREYVELGALYPATALVRARQAVRRLSAELDRLLSRTDVLLAPVSPGGPPRLDGPGMTMEEDLSGAASRYTALFNLTGHPAVSVPCGLSAEGLPLAVQVVGRRGEEQTVLNAAEAICATSGVGTPPAYAA
jgi:amidase